MNNTQKSVATATSAPTNSTQKYHFSNSNILLFSKFLDHFYVNKFVEECKEMIEIVSSGREMISYSSEIEFVASSIYYFLSILCHNATPGQLFNELKQYHHVEIGKEREEGIVRIPSIQQKIWTALLYALLPYLYQKKAMIWKGIYDSWTILFQSEETVEGRDGASMAGLRAEERRQRNREQEGDRREDRPRESFPSSPPEENETNNSHISDVPPSFLWILVKAFQRSIASISNEVDKCLERILLFGQDIHLAWFLYSGRYLEIPLRLTNTLLLTNKVVPSFQMKLKSLSWLLSFRLIILFYYGLRVFLSELDEQLHHTSSIVSSEGTSSTPEPAIIPPQLQERKTSELSNSSTSASVASFEKANQCPLCLDQIHQPAVLPCGHLGCWQCLLSYALKSPLRNPSSSSAASNSNDISSSSSSIYGYRPKSMIKCPVCRFEFYCQKIRPIVI